MPSIFVNCVYSITVDILLCCIIPLSNIKGIQWEKFKSIQDLSHSLFILIVSQCTRSQKIKDNSKYEAYSHRKIEVHVVWRDNGDEIIVDDANGDVDGDDEDDDDEGW